MEAPVTAPAPRGETSEALLAALAGAPGRLPPIPLPADGPLDGEDFALSLYLIYELHYRGVPGVDDGWEWEPSLLAVRAALEERFEAALVERLGPPSDGVAPEEMDLALRAIADADDAPSVSAYIERDAPLDHVLEFVVHRSAYQLKEADPHSFAIPRLWGTPKAALIALHRRWRGAIVGHLALFEMTSSIPNARYARGLRRLGFSGRATEFFDEHVEADAVHENLAAVDLAGGLPRPPPRLGRRGPWGAPAPG